MKHSGRWLLSEQHLSVPKHVTLWQKMRLALLVSIPLALLTSSEVLSCAHGADMSLDMSEKCKLVPVRIPSLFEQNLLKAVGRTQIEGSCKVYAGKTIWKTNWKLYPWSLASKQWGALEAPWQMTPIRAAFICSNACDIIAEDAFSVASQHSSVLFLRSARTAWFRTWRAIFVFFRTEIGRSQNSHFLFLNTARRPHTTQSDLNLSSWTFLELLDFHAPTEQICHLICRRNANLFQWEFQLVRTESLESSRKDTDRGKLYGVCGKD